MVSVVITSDCPGGGVSSAASSKSPSASGAPSASGRNSRAIRSNSSQPLGALIAADGVQGAVDEAGFGPVEERLGDLDIFVDHNLDRRSGLDQLIGPGAEDGASGGVDALQPPAGGQVPGDGAVDLGLTGDGAAHHLGEEFVVGLS